MARRHLRHGATSRHDGYLCDVSIERLLDSCRAQGVSGSLRIESWGVSASIEWHQGEVRTAFLGALQGAAALREIGSLRDGSFTLKTDRPVRLDAPPPRPLTAVAPAPAAPMVQAAHSAHASHGFAANRPAPPPLPVQVHAPLDRPMPTLVALSPAWPGQWSHGSGQAQPMMLPHACSTAQTNIMPRLRLPSTAVSVGILCATMLFSLVAVQL